MSSVSCEFRINLQKKKYWQAKVTLNIDSIEYSNKFYFYHILLDFFKQSTGKKGIGAKNLYSEPYFLYFYSQF